MPADPVMVQKWVMKVDFALAVPASHGNLCRLQIPRPQFSILELDN